MNESIPATPPPADVPLEAAPLQSDIPIVLMPEPQDPVIKAVSENHTDEEMGVSTRYEQMTLEQAAQELKDGRADIVLAGIAHDTPSVLDVILKHFRQPDTLVSSYFMMEKDGDQPLFFADCAVVPNPSPNQQVKIAEHTCESVKNLGYEPIVAFLSLETFEGDHATSEKIPGVVQVREAARRFKEQHPEIISYGPIQYDAATNREIFEKKAGSKGVEMVDGKMPNVLIFPDGMSGNITYKAKQDTHLATGPMITGTSKPFHDMSRGATEAAVVRGIEIARDEFVARRHADSLHDRHQ
jgi:phosphate acetyltransferase